MLQKETKKVLWETMRVRGENIQRGCWGFKGGGLEWKPPKEKGEVKTGGGDGGFWVKGRGPNCGSSLNHEKERKKERTETKK